MPKALTGNYFQKQCFVFRKAAEKGRKKTSFNGDIYFDLFLDNYFKK